MVTDAGGAKTAAAELGKVGEGAQAAGEGSRKAGEQAEEHHKHLEGLHKICHTLNEVFPGLGAVMQAAFSPVGAAVSIAVMALRYFLEKIKETNEEMKRLEEEAAKPLANRTEALRDQTVRMAVGMADLKEKLDKAKSGEMGLKEQIEHTSEAFKVQSGLAGTLSGALKDNELAHLEARHKAGLVSEEQYVQRKLEIEVNYIRKKRQLEEQAEMTEILLRRRLVAEAEAGALDPNEAEKKKEQAITKLHSLASKESINEAKKQADEALKKWEDKYPEIAEQFRKIGINADPNYAANRATIDANLSAARGPSRDDYMQWQQLMAGQRGAQRQYEQAPEAEAKAQVAADKASRDYEKAVQQVEALAEQKRDLERRESEYGIRKEGGRAVDRLSADTAAANAGIDPTKDAGVLGIVARGAQALQHNKPDVELAKFLTAIRQNNATMVDAIKNSQGSLVSLFPLMDQLVKASIGHEREIDRLKAQMMNVRN